jgi:hypothetical protein
MRAPRKAYKQLRVSISNFERIAGLNNRGVLQEFKRTCGLSKNQLVPRNIQCNGWRVIRSDRSITIQFLLTDQKTKFEEETFRFSFVR